MNYKALFNYELPRSISVNAENILSEALLAYTIRITHSRKFMLKHYNECCPLYPVTLCRPVLPFAVCSLRENFQFASPYAVTLCSPYKAPLLFKHFLKPILAPLQSVNKNGKTLSLAHHGSPILAFRWLKIETYTIQECNLPSLASQVTDSSYSHLSYLVPVLLF